MLPVTLGVGLINFNLVDQHVLRRSVRRPGARPRARSTRRSASTCSPRGCSPSPSPPSSSRASRASPPAATRSAFARPCRSASARSASSSCRRAPSARCSPCRSCGCSTSAARSTPSRRTSSPAHLAAFALGLTFNGTMLMLNRAFFSLQSAWVPTAIALGNLALNVVLDAVLYRVGVWGIPLATSIVNIAGTAALLVVLPQAPRPDRRPCARILLRAHHASPRPARREPPSAVWYGLDEVFGRSLGAQILSVGVGVLAGSGRLPRAGCALSASASCRRCSRSGGDQLQRARNELASTASATSPSSRTSTTASRRWPTACSR